MMEKKKIEAAVARIGRMEAIFDTLQKAAARPDAVQSPVFRALLTQLVRYYEDGRWMEDYQLERGVLSEDGIYHFLEDLKS